MSQNIDYLLIEKVLSKSATPNELDNFNKWLHVSEENRNEFNETKLIWDKYNGIHANKVFDNNEGLQAVRIKLAQNRKQKEKKKLFTYWISSAASIILLFGLFQILAFVSTNNLETYTSYNNAEKIVLADSSVVWLNKNSSLKISKRFNKNKRRVYLLGEGFFEVARDENKPFEVVSGKTITKVLGTSFNILEKSIENNTIITVNSGTVAFKKFRRFETRTILTKNQKATYYLNNNTIEKQQNNNLNYMSWKSNYLIFQDTPLSDVCKQLSKHFNTKITQHTNDSNLYLTGKYEGESLGEILNIIEITFNIHVDSAANEYSLYDVDMN
ncbi:MAG: FecR family protein [Salinivirgaceae bacterium]|jgi:transmembrane sensor|nr:FecR family protein [Salinivirgaceae bacterium]